MSRLSNATQEFKALPTAHQKKTGSSTAGFLFLLMDAVLLANFIHLMSRPVNPIPMNWPEVAVLVAMGVLGVAMIDGEGLNGISKVISAWAGKEGIISRLIPWGKKGAK